MVASVGWAERSEAHHCPIALGCAMGFGTSVFSTRDVNRSPNRSVIGGAMGFASLSASYKFGA